MLRIFSVKKFGYADEAKYVILWTKPNKMMGSSYATSRADVKAGIENLKRANSFKNIASFKITDTAGIAKWKENIRKQGYFTSYKDAKAAGVKV